MVLSDALRRMARMLDCDVVPAWVGDWQNLGRALLPLDGSERGHPGLPRRPIFAGGAATERVLRDLQTTERTRRERARDAQVRAAGGYESTPPWSSPLQDDPPLSESGGDPSEEPSAPGNVYPPEA